MQFLPHILTDKIAPHYELVRRFQTGKVSLAENLALRVKHFGAAVRCLISEQPFLRNGCCVRGTNGIFAVPAHHRLRRDLRWVINPAMAANMACQRELAGFIRRLTGVESWY